MMPPDNFPRKAKKHIEEAWRNYCLYERWLEIDPSWAVVLLFYSSLHLIQAHAENSIAKNQRVALPGDHGQRKQYIAVNLRRIAADYRELQAASEDTRYELVRYSAEDASSYYAEEFSRIVEDLYNKGVSWDLRLTEAERNAILNSFPA